MNEATGWLSVNVTVLVVAVIPLTVLALPAMTAGAPAMTSKNESPGDASFGDSIRSNVYLIACPVIGMPLANSSPGLIVNVYTLPPSETVGGWAMPPIGVTPAAPELSANVSIGVQVA